MTNEYIKEFDNEIIANEVMKVYKFMIDHPGSSIHSACEELGMEYHRTLDWINNGKLHEYLESIHDVRSDIAQIIALNELPSIVEFQSRIARGEASPRGSNPTAAAQFILDVAKLGSKGGEPSRSLSQVNVFIPNMDGQEAPSIDASWKIKS